NPHNTLNFSVALQPTLLQHPENIRSTMQNLQDKILAMPGVQAASALGGGLPLSGDDSEVPFWVDGKPKPATQQDMPFALFYLVDPGYVDTLKLPIQRGRFIERQDDIKSAPVVVIDENFAKKYFANEDPVGRYLNFELLDIKARI